MLGHLVLSATYLLDIGSRIFLIYNMEETNLAVLKGVYFGTNINSKNTCAYILCICTFDWSDDGPQVSFWPFYISSGCFI